MQTVTNDIEFEVNHWTNISTGNSPAYNVNFPQLSTNHLWLYVYFDGTNYNFYWSPDGIMKILVYSESATTFLAAPADQIGAMISYNNSTTTFKGYMNLFDWTVYQGAP